MIYITLYVCCLGFFNRAVIRGVGCACGIEQLSNAQWPQDAHARITILQVLLLLLLLLLILLLLLLLSYGMPSKGRSLQECCCLRGQERTGLCEVRRRCNDLTHHIAQRLRRQKRGHLEDRQELLS